MLFKIVLILTCMSTFQCSKFCSDYRTLDVLKRSSYDFSVKLLDSVLQDTKADDFVFSPLATWLQLTSLAEGARKKTLKQILTVTKHSTLQCLKKKWKKLINKMNSDLEVDLTLRNVIIIDKLFGVKKGFVRNVEKLKNTKVLLYNFNNIDKVADGTNDFIEKETDGKVSSIVYPDYFNSTYLVGVGVLYFTGSWKSAFQKQYTQVKDFYSLSGVKVGQVNMMRQSGYFNVTYIPVIKSRVLELPCSNERISMLVFIPKQQKHLLNFFYSLRRIELKSIFTMFKSSGGKYVNLELPRFKMSFEFDNIPELIYDLGARRMFSPNNAEFKGISDYTIFPSMLTQVADVEVTEEGVQARSLTVENLYQNSSEVSDFIANKPFVFMLIDKEIEVILFAGMYGKPTVYE
ncbi:serine protease inhibitor 27A [Amyelois transitella]|uniref:serine protease inhibitor 27A n=1 Tax=Amyelois transitella TaxID=680683 RepID=UPI0029906B44|nr:serine protease inhibitor 27A [Amyelois transitella]